MAEVTAVTSLRTQTVTVLLQVRGLPRVKANSVEGLPSWLPDSLSLTFHEFDGMWVRPDHGTLHGTVERGIGSVSRAVERGEPLWEWVAEQITAYDPRAVSSLD